MGLLTHHTGEEARLSLLIVQNWSSGLEVVGDYLILLLKSCFAAGILMLDELGEEVCRRGAVGAGRGRAVRCTCERGCGAKSDKEPGHLAQ